MQTNETILFCKGAETHIFPRCTIGNIEQCKHDINKFAQKGWRTLAFAYKKLTFYEYNRIESNINEAINDVLNREDKLKKVFESIESNLQLIGATAVEDKLQENVADTLESLRRAGIKIWVLTGDKKETALNISHSCKHFSYSMKKLFTTDLKEPEEIKAMLKLHQKK